MPPRGPIEDLMVKSVFQAEKRAGGPAASPRKRTPFCSPLHLPHALPVAESPMTAIAIMGLVPRSSSGMVTTSSSRGRHFQKSPIQASCPKRCASGGSLQGRPDIRNRATIGGNIGANKSCSSLIPFLLVAEARYSRVGAPAILAGEWQAAAEAAAAERGFIAALEFEAPPSRRFTCGRYARTSCDVSVLTCAVSAELAAVGHGRPILRGLRVAMGGLSPHARRFPEIERLFEASSLPAKAEIEAAAAPLFSPKSDVRGSADFKRYRAAALLADVLTSMEAQA